MKYPAYLGIDGDLVLLPLLARLVSLLLGVEDVSLLLHLLGLNPGFQGICY